MIFSPFLFSQTEKDTGKLHFERLQKEIEKMTREQV